MSRSKPKPPRHQTVPMGAHRSALFRVSNEEHRPYELRGRDGGQERHDARGRPRTAAAPRPRVLVAGRYVMMDYDVPRRREGLRNHPWLRVADHLPTGPRAPGHGA